MRLISILIGLAIIAFMVNKQLNTTSVPTDTEVDVGGGNNDTPKVPTSPEGVKQFEADMDKFMQDTEAQRNKKLEETLSE
ncbi:hypothetical protein [Microbulbifer pacificus]|uniref:Uncharacterized protein n=1 Tax=Microbulbifer pacificus TaxID=407164 RepID=A0AAU0MYG2_9GAMM|nr:hypothetical protein [Microbulbifer pacificus]WOX05752.1 hypothetical protein R5R33_00985 [Microbulbifer pacificus]